MAWCGQICAESAIKPQPTLISTCIDIFKAYITVTHRVFHKVM